MKTTIFLLCSLLPVIVFSFHGKHGKTIERCNRKPFQIPNYYVIHIRGYSLLRHCPQGTFYIPHLCRCVTRRLVSILVENNPITTRTDPSITKEEPPRSSPGVSKDMNLGVSTDIPMLTNSLAVKEGLLNVKTNGWLQNEIMKPSKKPIKQRQHNTKNSTKSQVALTLKNKARKSISKSRKGKREKTKNKEEKSNAQKSLLKHKNDHQHHIAENSTISSRKEGPVITKLNFTRNQDTTNQSFCNPYFKFVFDRTSLSADKSVPSSPSKSLQYLGVAGSTGKTSAYFDGNGWVTVWGMSYITFAPKFKFQIRFRLREDYPYEDEFYTLISDGPCEGSQPKYSVSVNPVRREIHSFITLKSENELDLLLSEEEITKWVTVSLQGTKSEITLSTDSAKTTGNIGVSTIKSSACPMEIGKKTPLSQGFVGFIDTVQFHNCF